MGREGRGGEERGRGREWERGRGGEEERGRGGKGERGERRIERGRGMEGGR